MRKQNKTRKIILAVTAITAMSLAGIQLATASPGPMQGKGPGPGPGYQKPCYMQEQQLDEETIKARDALLSETVELRKKMAQKRAEKRALMKSDNPDPAKAAALAGEIFDIREQLRTKATAAGVPMQMLMGKGRMGDRERMSCDGRCQGHGSKRGYRM